MARYLYATTSCGLGINEVLHCDGGVAVRTENVSYSPHHVTIVPIHGDHCQLALIPSARAATTDDQAAVGAGSESAARFRHLPRPTTAVRGVGAFLRANRWCDRIEISDEVQP